MDNATAALSLSWCFGFNKNIPGGVHSLSNENRHAMMYVAAHTGIIYDYQNKEQTMLQGHCNPITCCCVSEDKRWIVTADTGKESMLVVWDSINGSPIKTIYEPHATGVIAVDISPDAMFLVTLSSVSDGKEGTQEISVWEWSTDHEGPLYTTTIATEDVQTCVKFNTYDIREIVSNGKQRVIFWNWSSRKLDFFAPPLAQRDFHQHVGEFTQSLFVPDSKQAITSTEDGDIILWDKVLSPNEEILDRQAVKLIRVSGGDGSQGVRINILTEIDGYLVIGSDDGAVRFYDFDFRLIAWFEDLKAGGITSISFGNTGLCPEMPESQEGSLTVPKFIVGTKKAFVVGVDPTSFYQLDIEKKRGILLVQGLDDEVHGISCHPTETIIALCTYGGSIQLWDYATKRLAVMRAFDTTKLRPQTIEFSRDGTYAVVGFTNGVLKILNAQSLKDISSFRESKKAITKIRISQDSQYIAVCDLENYVAIWQIVQDAWIYIGRIKSHSKTITCLEFSTLADNPFSLISVGEDRKLVEYDVAHSSMAKGVVLKCDPKRVEQCGIPTCCAWHPEQSSVQEDLLIIANDEYKIKHWNVNNKVCRCTTLGPTYGDAINRIIPFPKSDASDVSYCIYSTAERVVGLLKLPLDGNPNKSIGLIAHPGEISGIALSHKAKQMFTAGGADNTVNMWDIWTRSIDQLEKAGGEGIAPYVSLLEGGPKGDFYNEIVDYFYYCQIRSQGEGATNSRQVTGTIPIEEIPQLMRALGYYPSEEEIQTMCSEMKYINFTKTTEVLDTITFDDFIKLYINYRPVFGVGKEHVEDAFKRLGAEPDLDWSDIKAVLMNRGEKLSKEELRNCLSALVADEIPKRMNAMGFADKVYGFEDYE